MSHNRPLTSDRRIPFRGETTVGDVGVNGSRSRTTVTGRPTRKKERKKRNTKGGSNLDAFGASAATYKSAIKHQRPERKRFLSLPSIYIYLRCLALLRIIILSFFLSLLLSLLLSSPSLGQQNRVVELCCHPLKV